MLIRCFLYWCRIWWVTKTTGCLVSPANKSTEQNLVCYSPLKIFASISVFVVCETDRGPLPPLQTIWSESAKRANFCRRKWRPLSTTSRICEHLARTHSRHSRPLGSDPCRYVCVLYCHSNSYHSGLPFEKKADIPNFPYIKI